MESCERLKTERYCECVYDYYTDDEVVKYETLEDAKDYFAAVRAAMGVDDIKEFWNTWEIAPKYDAETLREMYLDGEIFRVGKLVEDVNTGLRGRIIRRGTSYLICVTEDDIMFKSWVKDLTEVTKVSGVPADQRLVGTDALRKYAQSMVPGQSWGLQFINKYKSKK